MNNKLRLAQIFNVQGEFNPTKASVFLKRSGENDRDSFYLSDTVVIDATNFLNISGGDSFIGSLKEEDIDLIPNSVAQYKMNDTSGSTIIDSTGNYNGTHNGTLTSVDPGKINTAIDYDGSTNYTEIPNPTEISGLSAELSIAFWIKTTATEAVILDARYSPLSNNGLRISLLSGDIECSFFESSSGVLVKNTTNVNDGNWHLVILTADKAGLATVYIDNDDGGTTMDISSKDTVYVNSFFIGAEVLESIPIAFAYFEGSLDNFCIFDKILTSDERDFLWNNTEGTEDLSSDVTEEFTFEGNLLTINDAVDGYTGNGYMSFQEIGSISTLYNIDYQNAPILEYPVTASEAKEYFLILRGQALEGNPSVGNPSAGGSREFKVDILLDGVVIDIIEENFVSGDPMDWVTVTSNIVFPDTSKHTLGIRIRSENTTLDRIAIPGYDLGSEAISDTKSPYITIHMQVYKVNNNFDILDEFPIYDFKNSLDEVLYTDWYNFNIKSWDSDVDYSENAALVLSSSGSDSNNFIVWELIDNNEYQASPSAIKT